MIRRLIGRLGHDRTTALEQPPSGVERRREISSISGIYFGWVMRWFEEDPAGSGTYHQTPRALRSSNSGYLWFLHQGAPVKVINVYAINEIWFVALWYPKTGQVHRLEMPAPILGKKQRCQLVEH